MSNTNTPVLQWRKFEFFNVHDGADNGVLESLIKPGSSATCTCSGRGLVFIGDSAGFVHCLARSLHSPVPSFPAHDAPLSWIWAADTASVLVTLAHPSNSCSEIKVWAPDRLQAEQPVLLRLLRPDPRPPLPRGAGSASHPPPPRVTAVAVHPNLNVLALGFSSGAVMLYRGDLGKERERGSTSRVLVTLSTGAVTNAHFHLSTQTYTAHTPSRGRRAAGGAPPAAVSVQTTSLLVTTASNVYTIACTHRDKETTAEVDNVGCRSGCSALADGRSDHHIFVMARDDALYSYSADGRAGCYAFPGQKLSLHCYRGYALVTATQPDSNTATAAGAGNSAARAGGSKIVCTIYDLANKVIALSHTMPGPLLGAVSEWGALYGLCRTSSSTSSLIHFREKDLHTKMEILFKKNQYDIAVSLAKGQSVSGEGVAEILKQYGDWLYSKGDLQMAVHQYIKTIPYLEPSYVIKKFLSSEHMPLLAEYLEALHARNLHSPDHSSLLLNCYTRHKHDHRIHSFINKHSEQVSLTKKLKENQMRNGGPASALSTTKANEDSATVAAMNLINGRSTSGQFSAADVEVLVGVCREGGFHEEALKLTSLHELHALHLDVLCNDTKEYHRAVQYIRSLPFSVACDQAVAHGSALARGCPDDTLLLLIDLATDYTPDNTPLVGEAPLDSYLSSREPDSAPPELFESVVCGDSLLAIRYIEGVCKRQAQLGRPRPPPRLTEMLLAEYLHQLNIARDDVVKDAWDHKVHTIISADSEYPVDPSLACLLCDRHNYPKGKLIIWEQHCMYSEILQYHMSVGDEQSLLLACEQHGSGQPGLWLTALRLITAPSLGRQPDTRALQTILDRVDSHSLLPPMEVVGLLSASEHVTVGQAGRYLARLSDREERLAEEQRTAVAECVAKSDVVRDQIQEIMDSGLVFTESKCDACQKELEFPTVHFFCKHSFHQHCFASYCSSSEEECPVCLPRHNDIRDALRHQASDRAAVTRFGEGGEEEEVFAQLSQYLARGLFTDYSATLAAQTARHHTPAPKAARQQKAIAAATALESSTNPASESRLRLKETRPHQTPVSSSSTSEGRLRQEAAARGSTPHGLPASTDREGRVRAQETRGSAVDATGSSEGRVRQQQQTQVMDSGTEGRVRSSVASSVAIPQSEARLRTQSRKFGGQGFTSKPNSPSLGGRSPYDRPASLTDHFTVSGSSSVPVRAPEQRARVPDSTDCIEAAVVNLKPSHNKPSSAHEANPFADGTLNPFGDDFETEEDIEANPFASETDDEKNPFKDDSMDSANPFSGAADDYDKKLNPFGE